MLLSKRLLILISIHAPVKGATVYTFCAYVGAPNFNPRSREGSDQHEQRHGREAGISIHAPVKGATMPRPIITPTSSRFQSTLP